MFTTSSRLILTSLAIACGLPAVGSSQALLGVHVGPGADSYGEALANLGDINGDGRADYIIGDKEDNTAGNDAGRIEIRSGLDHSLLLALNGANAGDWFGRQVAAMGDINLDGVPDWAVSSPRVKAVGGGSLAGRVELRSGTNGAVLQSWSGTSPQQLGEIMHALDDMDGDGRRDIMFTRGHTSSSLRAVVVRSSGTGALLLELPAWALGVSSFAYTIAPTGDFDSDGRADIALASEHWLGVFNDYRVHIHSSATGALIHEFLDTRVAYPEPTIVTMPDMNGDGVDELAIAQRDAPDDRVTVFSGATFTELWHIDQPVGWSSFGYGLGSWPDANGDGLDDLVVQYGHGVFWDRQLALLSGIDGTQLSHLDADETQFKYLGGRLVRGPDMNGDGIDDVLVGCPTPAFWNDPGAVRVLSGVCNGQVQTYGTGLAGSGGFMPTLTSSGCPAAGTPMTLQVLDGLGSAPVTMVIGMAAASIPFKQGTLLVDPSVLLLIPYTLSLPAGPGEGKLTLDLQLPDDPSLSGLNAFFQMFIKDAGAPGGWSMTGGVEWVLG